MTTYTVEVHQWVKYTLTVEADTPEEVVEQIDSGEWDDSENRVLRDRVLVSIGNTQLHDSNPTFTHDAEFKGVEVSMYDSTTKPGHISIQVDTNGCEDGQKILLMLNDSDLFQGDPEED